MVVVRTTSVEYLDAWREREIDVDFMVSSELETANAISGLIGIPAARQTDVFADGQGPGRRVRRARRRPSIDRHAAARARRCRRTRRSSAIIRGDEMLPSQRRRAASSAGDRIVVIALARLGARVEPRDVDEHKRVDDIVIFGGGRMGTTIARVLLDRGIRVRFVEGRAERAREVAEELPEARVFHASRVRSRVLRARADRPRDRRGVRAQRRPRQPVQRGAGQVRTASG